jgi:hypothetical protein
MQSYLLGRYLKQRGETELARNYLERGMTTSRKHKLFHGMLRDLNESLADAKKPRGKTAPSREKSTAKGQVFSKKSQEKAGASKPKATKKPAAEKAALNAR